MQTELSNYTAIIGIDWADKKHDVCIHVTATGKQELLEIPHRSEKIDEWARSLHRKHGGPMAVALELSKGPIVAALQKYDFFVLYPVNPSSLVSYRRTFTPSGAKDDPTDAAYILNLLLRHPDQFHPLQPQSVEMRALMTLTEQRRRLMNDRVRLTNRLRNALKQYYPQALEWFDRIDTRLFCDFIRRWPTAVQARRARKATLETFFRSHNMNRKPLIEKRITAIKSAVPLMSSMFLPRKGATKEAGLLESWRLPLGWLLVSKFPCQVKNAAVEPCSPLSRKELSSSERKSLSLVKFLMDS